MSLEVNLLFEVSQNRLFILFKLFKLSKKYWTLQLSANINFMFGLEFLTSLAFSQ